MQEGVYAEWVIELFECWLHSRTKSPRMLESRPAKVNVESSLLVELGLIDPGRTVQ